MDLTQIMQAINAVSQKVNDLGRRLDDYINSQTGQNAANIDFIAMMTDVDIPESDDKTVLEEGENAQ